MERGQGLRRAALFVTSSRVPSALHRRHLSIAIGGAVFLVGINVLVYLAPIDYTGLASFNYLGAFVVTFVANALVVVPVPYIPIVAHMGASAGSPALVVVLGAFGSALGESVAFVVGRAEEGLISERPFYQRIHRISRHPLLAGLVLFLFAAPFNPIFDVAGLAAGAAGVQYRVFFIAVFLGRLVRLAAIVWLGMHFGLGVRVP